MKGEVARASCERAWTVAAVTLDAGTSYGRFHYKQHTELLNLARSASASPPKHSKMVRLSMHSSEGLDSP